MIWEITGLMIQDKPLFGVGQGNYAVEYLNYQATYFEDSTHSENEIKAANIIQSRFKFEVQQLGIFFIAFFGGFVV